MISGQLNKQIPARFAVKVNTIKVHRARVMQKMQTKTLADLVRAAEKAGIADAILRKENIYPSSADDGRKRLADMRL